jgi:general secretion pathway protein I
MRSEPAQHARGSGGFTLIEVLVALAIVAFGLIAVFGQLNQTVTAASYLRNKTLAHWVAMNRLAELRLSGTFPGASTSSDDVEMANTTWHYEETFSETEDAGVRRVDLTVSHSDDPDRPLATAVGFLVSRPPVSSAGTGWTIIDPNAEPEPEPTPTPSSEQTPPTPTGSTPTPSPPPTPPPAQEEQP